MDKVYLVTTLSGSYDDFESKVVSVYKSLESAEKEKTRIENKVQSIKDNYKDQYNSDYEKDLNYVIEGGNIAEDVYENIMERVYTFQYRNPKLEIHTINIEEREVI